MSIFPGFNVNTAVINLSAKTESVGLPLFVDISFVKDENSAQTYPPKKWNKYDDDSIPDYLKNPPGTFLSTMRLYFDNSGGPCYSVSIRCQKDNLQRELQKLSDLPDVNLVAVPSFASLPDFSKNWQNLIACFEGRTDLFFIIDLPMLRTDMTTEGALLINQLGMSANLADMLSFSAGYWPWIIDASNIPLPPSAIVMATYQRADREKGIWQAPANMSVSSVTRLTDDVAESPEKYDSVPWLNPLCSFPGRGIRVWGCRTLAWGSQRNGTEYIQVRRLLSYVENRMSRLAGFMMFEPNNAITWEKFRGVASAWLRKLWHAGALYGDEEKLAWQLMIGVGETMTSENVQNNTIIVQVRLAVMKPAEFIDLKLIMNQAQSGMASASFLYQSDVSAEL